jgi:hypothetical protein
VVEQAGSGRTTRQLVGPCSTPSRAPIGDVYAPGSRRYAELASFLLTPAQWEPQRLEFCHLVGKPVKAAEALAMADEELHTSLVDLEVLLARGGDTGEVRLTDDGELIIGGLRDHLAGGQPVLSPAVTKRLITRVAASGQDQRKSKAAERLKDLNDRERASPWPSARGKSNAESTHHLSGRRAHSLWRTSAMVVWAADRAGR